MLNSWLKRNPSWQYGVRYLHASLSIAASFFKPARISSTDNKVLFIVGSGRSGNTLLRRVLIEDFDIYIPPESYVFGSVVSSALYARSLSWPDLVDLTLAKFNYFPEFTTFEAPSLAPIALECKSWPKEKQAVGNIVTFLYRHLAEDKNIPAEWVGDKTPLNTMNLGLISNMFPKAKYLYIERDGADVVSSYVQAKIYDNVEDAAKRWIDSRQAWLKHKKTLSDTQFLEIKYENLVSSVEPCLDEICKVLGLPLRAENLDVNARLGDVSTLDHHAQVKQPITNTNIGKGRQKLTGAQRKVLSAMMNEGLVQAGYDKL